MPNKKATTEQIIAAYEETRSAAKAAQLLGMCRQSVQERLHRAGYPLLGPRRLSDEERVAGWLARTVINENGCWIWTGAKKGGGYGNVGVIRVDGTKGNAGLHRVVYEHLIGPVPEGLELDHLCRNRACCNPDHLEPVTRSVNLRRGVGVGGRRLPLKTHCHRGHAFDEANTWVCKKTGVRKCRACDRENHRRAAAERKAAALCLEEIALGLREAAA